MRLSFLIRLLFIANILGVAICSSCESSADDIIDPTTGGTLSGTIYTVSFDTDGGSYVAPVKVAHGATIGRPDAPTLEGYFFDDWYNSEKRLTRWDFDTPIVEDLTIYAKWSDTEIFDTSTYDLCIYSKSELVSFRNIVNDEDSDIKAILMSNIDLEGEEWSPIGTVNTPFKGVFEGNGYTISNLAINMKNSEYLGLFGYVDGGSILNLRMKEPIVKGREYVGSVCGYLYGGVIENCSIYDGYIYGDDYYVGGIVGYADYTNVTNCYSLGNVVGYSNCGGVIGNASSSTVVGCYNSGSVKGCSIGGVIGESGSSTVTACYNTANLSGYGSHVGGVIGEITTSTITECFNTGSIENSYDDSAVGGVIGTINLSSSLSSMNSSTSSSFSLFVNVISCYNMGSVLGYGMIGGVVGDIYSFSHAYSNYSAVSSSAAVTIKACYNTGSVSSENDNYLGGIVGYAYALSLSNAYSSSSNNYKPYSSTTSASITINGCYNVGELIGGSDFVGGVVGCDLCKSNQDTSSKLYSTASISINSCSYIPFAGVAYTNDYGAAESDLVSTLKSLGVISTLNYRAGQTHWEYDSNSINNGYPILTSIDY